MSAVAISQGTAKALLVTEKGTTTVYRDGCDWRVVGPTGEGRYFSVWGGDVIGSLKRAMKSVIEEAGDQFRENEILYPTVILESVL